MVEEKLSEQIQFYLTPSMKNDLKEMDGDMSENIREALGIYIKSKKIPKEQIQKELEYHEEEAKKTRTMLERIDSEEKEETEDKFRERTTKEKLDEYWPKIKQQIDTGGLEYTLSNQQFIDYYCRQIGIKKTELIAIITERYNNEKRGLEKKDEKSITERFDELWPDITKHIDEYGIDSTLENREYLVEYSRILRIPHSRVKTMIKEKYNEEIKNKVEYNKVICNVMS